MLTKIHVNSYLFDFVLLEGMAYSLPTRLCIDIDSCFSVLHLTGNFLFSKDCAQFPIVSVVYCMPNSLLYLWYIVLGFLIRYEMLKRA